METRDDGAPGFEVIYSCRLPKHGCQEPNLGPLQGQCALLTAEPPFQPLVLVFFQSHEKEARPGGAHL